MHTETPLLAASPRAEQEVLLSVLQPHDTSNKNHTRPPPRSGFPPQPNHHHELAKSWQAPIIMLSSLLSAIALAILHDTMNRSLNGNTVNPDGPWNQQWTSRYGTALAFFIGTLFVVCVGTAFVQKQWLNISTRQQTLRIRNLDVLSSALSNPFCLVSSLTWLQNPLLLMIAMTSWYDIHVTYQ